MISEKFAIGQMSRLSRLRNFPNQIEEAPLRADLAAVLREATSEDQLESIVDDWLAEAEDSPTVSQMRAAVRARQTAKVFGCQACNGTGFLLRRINDLDYASPCNCRKGRVA